MEAGELNPSLTRNLGFSAQKLENPPLTIIHLTGQISAPEGLAPVMAVAVSPETEHVAILMESVEYINSKGCGRLIALHREVQGRGFQMFIVGPVGRVARVMEGLGCHKILCIRQSLGEAITEMAATP